MGTEMQGEDGHVTVGAEVGAVHSPAQGCRELPAATTILAMMQEGFFPPAVRGGGPCQHLGFRPLAPRTLRKSISVGSHSVYDILFRQPRGTDAMPCRDVGLSFHESLPALEQRALGSESGAPSPASLDHDLLQT